MFHENTLLSRSYRSTVQGLIPRLSPHTPVFPAVGVAAFLMTAAWGLSLSGWNAGESPVFVGQLAGVLCLLVAVFLFAGYAVAAPDCVRIAEADEAPDEIVRNVLLFLVAFVPVALMLTFAALGAGESPKSVQGISAVRLIALAACMIPTSVGAAPFVHRYWMRELATHGIAPVSRDALEKSARVDTVVLRGLSSVLTSVLRVEEFIPAPRVPEETLVCAARRASMHDGTPSGRAIIDFSRRLVEPGTDCAEPGDLTPRDVRKGAPEEITRLLEGRGAEVPRAVRRIADDIVRSGGIPLLVMEGTTVLGAVHLRRVLRDSVAGSLVSLRRWDVRTLLLDSGDEAVIASAAAEAGIDDFRANVPPEQEKELFARLREEGRVLAGSASESLCGRDVVLSRSERTDADFRTGGDDPAKLPDTVVAGKRFAAMRSLLTLFGGAVDISKCVVLVPAVLAGASPAFRAWDVFGVSGAAHLLPAAVLFNTIILGAELFMLLRGIEIPAASREKAHRRFLLAWGAAGLLAPFVCLGSTEFLLSALSSGLDRFFG